MTDRTCAERIAEEMQGRADHLADLFNRAEDYMDEEVSEEARDEINELPLAVDVVKTIKVLLSTGGPADGLTIELDTEGNVSSVRYWFADWFDRAETVVTEDSPLWRYATELAEYEWEMG